MSFSDLDSLVTLPPGRGLALLTDAATREMVKHAITEYSRSEAIWSEYRPDAASDASPYWQWSELGEPGAQASQAALERSQAIRDYGTRIWSWYQGKRASGGVPQPTKGQLDRGLRSLDGERLVRVIEGTICDRIKLVQCALAEFEGARS